LKEKFKAWGNYMTEDEEEELGFDQGIMEEADYIEYDRQLKLKKTESVFAEDDKVGNLFK